jgi:acyl-coenzyme A synthetase/AMP-(fatty) acid ligase
VYWFTADIGWVTGHTYIVCGPLANAATQVVYEGTPASPDQAPASPGRSELFGDRRLTGVTG